MVITKPEISLHVRMRRHENLNICREIMIEDRGVKLQFTPMDGG